MRKVIPIEERGKTRCGAKTRAGTPCQLWPIKGKNRCKFHGGMNPGAKKGNDYSWKNGIYAKGIKDEEREIYEKIKVGTLGEEIRIIKMQLIRAVTAQKEFEETSKAKAVDLETIENNDTSFKKDDTGWEKKEVKRKHPDYRKIIFQLSGRIAKLELTHSALKRNKIVDQIADSSKDGEYDKQQLIEEVDRILGVNNA